MDRLSENSPKWIAGATLAVLRRPVLWPTAVRQMMRLRRAGWWRRAPFLPVPDPDYLRFRFVTAYGGEGTLPPTTDVVTYLHWCRSWPTLA